MNVPFSADIRGLRNRLIDKEGNNYLAMTRLSHVMCFDCEMVIKINYDFDHLIHSLFLSSFP